MRIYNTLVDQRIERFDAHLDRSCPVQSGKPLIQDHQPDMDLNLHINITYTVNDSSR